MFKSKLPGLALAAGIGLAGCAASPSPEQAPQPMPQPGTTLSPGSEATKPCTDVLDHKKLQFIVKDQAGVLTLRLTGTEYISVYKPGTQTRIGNLAAGSVFAALCRGALPGEEESWFIHHGPDYSQAGAVYVANVSNPPKEEIPGWGCDVPPYLGYIISNI